MLKSETKRGFVSVIAALGAVTLLVFVVENSINGGRHEFERKVAAGQSKDELRSLIGIPQAILKLGDSLEHWGNAPKKLSKPKRGFTMQSLKASIVSC
jgi:hypothetical protein